ncbi:MAG: cytochrome c oxidase subunit I [Gammaproteobacteria bacterium]|nr:cytochrome c oxidase subunit I [Gammaproteobacteria bacterium]
MSANAAHDPDLARAQAERLIDVWRSPTGWRYWSDVNNTSVGLWYTAAAFLFMIFGGVLALIMRAQLAVPDNDLVSADLYNQALTLHGSVMMFLFAVPVFEAFSIMVLPQMLGARDLPFPRLSAYGFWCFVLGGVFVCGSIFFDAAPKAGWFMYPPLTTAFEEGIGPDIWLLGLSFIEVAAIAAAVELIVGVLKCRPPGMRINLIPLYSWYILVVAVMILFAFPPLIAGDVLMELERLLDWPFFDASRGGDPLLWQHLFWIFGHPEVYIIFLPAVALVAMIVPTFAQRPIVGYGWIVLAAVGTGFISFGLWVHHMYTTGLPGISLGFFSAASEAVVIPTGVQIFAFLATVLAARRLTFSVPMLFVAGALAIFVLGGLTGVMVALVPFDLQAHDTYFVVAHLHYVLIGGMLFPVAAGLYYFFPLAVGHQLSERLGKWAFWLMFVGFNVTFLPMHLTGLKGMPRRVFTYPADLGLDLLNLISSIGAYALAAGIALLLWEVVRPKKGRPYAERNPWHAGTLEWLAEMPAKPWGVRSIPFIESRYPLWEQQNFVRDVDQGRFYLPDAEEGERETLVTTAIDAEPIQCLRVATPTFNALLAALFTGGVFIFATFHWWWLALASGVAALAVILVWLWTGTAVIPEKPAKDVGLGVTLPLYLSGRASVGWWAMFITMMADMTAFVSLVFGYLFYWTVNARFPPAGAALLEPALIAAAAFALGGAWLATLAARSWNRASRSVAAYAALGAGAVLATAGTALSLRLIGAEDFDPTAHVHPATVAVLVWWIAVHAAVGVLMLVYCAARLKAGRMTPRYDIDLSNTALYWHFVAIEAAVTFALLALFAAGG